jgi:hypothetical protein
MKKMPSFLVLLLAVTLVLGFAGCPVEDDGKKDDTTGGDGIKWTNEPSGTLTVLNNTSKDMVLFQGQTPTTSSILGGVRAQTTKTFDISDDVDDFEVGGYIILRGMSSDEYNKNKSNLANAKIEYSAMATYGQGKKFRAEINPAYSGDYYFRVTNGGRIGIELRKNSPDGEKIGYLPALATNYALYSSTSDNITIFPVYVFFSNVTKQVTTIRSTSFVESASVGPRSVTDSTFATVRFPNDQNIQWATIAASIVYPVAFVTVTNTVANQSARVASSSMVYRAQNGYDSLNSGETNTFEIKGSDEGQSLNLNMLLYGDTVPVPIKQSGDTPLIKNGYNYTVTLNYNGSGALDSGDSYTATITEGTKRDVSNEISSL